MDYQRTATGIAWTSAGIAHSLDWYGADIVRVRAWPAASIPHERSLCVTATPQPPGDWSLAENEHGLILSAGSLSACIEPDGTIRFEHDHTELIREKPGTLEFPRNALPNPEDRTGCTQTFTLNDHDAIYGLGQFTNGVLNWRGHEATLIHGNVTVVVPFLCSTGGWGILWDNPSHTEFEDNDDGMRLWSEVGDGMDYYLCTGGSMAAAIAGYRRLTGTAPLFPRAFYGFIQCKERYRTADELAQVVQEHRDRHIPLDVIVQDWWYWGKGQGVWSSMVHDPEWYGDLPGAIQAIHANHAKVMISIWPRIGLDSALGRELLDQGHMFDGTPNSRARIYDAFAPAARAIYWKHVNAGLFAHGIDAWWMDGTEPEFLDCHDPFVHKASQIAQRDTAAGSWARVLNAYCLATTTGVYEGQRAVTDDKRVFILTRSAWAGQQRNGAATWSGDISANWETFARQIPAGLNFCMSGIPYWTTDNGAFFVRGRGGTFPAGVEDPAFREFFLRWFQYSCFCPLMRSHGTQTPREIWQFGDPGEVIYDTLVAFDQLRMRLLPYSYSLAGSTTLHHDTPMRPLAMDFSDDPRTYNIDDQFMYGPALMACPVTVPMVNPPTERCDVLTAWGQCRVDGRNGMTIRCFDGIDATMAADERHSISDMDHSWSGNPPAGASGEEYRVEISCDLVVDVPAERDRERILLVQFAGRLRVELDGAMVVDDWTDGPLREHRIPVPASPAASTPLRIIYGHTTGDAVIKAGWELDLDSYQACDGLPQEREVYLPAGHTWHDVWTGARYEGGQTVALPAPLQQIPVLCPAGAILPLGSVKQWHDETPDNDMELRIYPGTDGQFTLYEDAGDGYAYERGACSEIDFRWNDDARTLVIGERRGSFPGMLTSRTFRVVLVREGHGTGIGTPDTADHCMAYDGHAITAAIAAAGC
jgi:alpha-D-xyloside xylohydrolase